MARVAHPVQQVTDLVTLAQIALPALQGNFVQQMQQADIARTASSASTSRNLGWQNAKVVLTQQPTASDLVTFRQIDRVVFAWLVVFSATLPPHTENKLARHASNVLWQSTVQCRATRKLRALIALTAPFQKTAMVAYVVMVTG